MSIIDTTVHTFPLICNCKYRMLYRNHKLIGIYIFLPFLARVAAGIALWNRSVCAPALPPISLSSWSLCTLGASSWRLERTWRKQSPNFGCAPGAAETSWRLQARDLGRAAAATPRRLQGRNLGRAPGAASTSWRLQACGRWRLLVPRRLGRGRKLMATQHLRGGGPRDLGERMLGWRR
jgi:hypothetical protein